MTEAVAVAAAPEAPAAPPPDAQAEGVKDDSKPAEAATATDGAETPKTGDQPEQPPRRGNAERKIKRLYREIGEHKAHREMLEKRLAELERQPPQRPQADPDEPKLEQYGDIEEFRVAVSKHAAEKERKKFETERQSQAQRQFIERLTSSWEEKSEKASEKYDDFEAVVGDLRPVNPLTVAIMDEENGAEVAYHLAKNPAEAQRIAQLHPIAQAREIGKLAAKLAAEPAKPKTPSKAPAPITPVGGKSGGANDLPQDSDDMATWLRKERAREKKLRGG